MQRTMFDLQRALLAGVAQRQCHTTEGVSAASTPSCGMQLHSKLVELDAELSKYKAENGRLRKVSAVQQTARSGNRPTAVYTMHSLHDVRSTRSVDSC